MRENSYLKIIYLTNLPVIIQAVDREKKIRNIIPELKRILPEN
jgi:PII-like signaling protein